MEHRYLNIIRRWLWLIILSAVVAGSLTYWVIQQQPLSYSARARLLVGPGIDSPDPDLDAFRAGAQLMQTYAELPTTGPFLQTLIDELDLDIGVEELRERISISANQETQVLSVMAQDNDPAQAVAITNAIAETLVLISPSGSSNPATQLESQIRTQAQRLEQHIVATEGIIAELEEEFQSATDLNEQRMIREEITAERSQLSDAHNILADLFKLLQTTNINRVEIIEPAGSAFPVANQVGLKVMMGALVGLILSFLVVFAFEYWSNTVNDVEGLVHAARVPVLGAIAQHKKLRGTPRERLAVQALPKSEAAENYRMLGTKLLHSSDFKDLRSVLISTTEPSGDTGELVANLAIVLSQTGSRVVLVDANLHRPTMGQIFDINGRPGLTDVLTGEAERIELTPIDWAPGLSILPSGPISFDSFVLLASPRMTYLLTRLEEMSDIVLVVASSVLSFADSLFLTNHVDGVILAARSGKTQSDMIQNAISSLRLVGAPLMGMVLLNSRKGSVKTSRMSDRRISVGRPAVAMAPQVNGHARGNSLSQEQLAAGFDLEQTVPTKPTQSPDKH